MSGEAERAFDKSAGSRPARRAVDLFFALTQAAVCFGLLLIALLWSFVYLHIEEQHRLSRASSERELSNLARAFTEHVSRSVKEIDASLLLLRRAMLAQGDGFKLGEYTSSNYFKNELLFQITSVDRDGFIVDSNLGSPAQSMNLNDREHITVHRERPGQDLLYISRPLVGRLSGRWSIQFTRKILDEKGDFDGVLVASVNPEFLSNYYATFDIYDGAITLVGHDGIVYARGSAADGDYVGKTVGHMTAVRAAAARSSCFKAVSGLDGIEKLFCAREVPGVAQDVVVTIPLEGVDADVNAMRTQLTLLALLITLCCFPLMGMAVARRYKLSRAMRELEIARGEAASVARNLRCALENISDGIMFFNAEGNILVSNDQAFLHLGLDPQIARPTSSQKFSNNAQVVAGVRGLAINRDDEHSYPEGLADLTSSLSLSDAPLLLALCAGPDDKVLQLRTHRLDDGGYVRTIADVTQTYNDSATVARARDDALAATQARSSFLARMSHEIRTPLHAALGFTQLLAHEKLSVGGADIVQNIQLSTSHLIAIVDDILDFSTIEAGRLRMSVGALDIPALMARLEAIAKPLVADRDVSLEISIAPGTPQCVRTDERRLLQILTNLLCNAIKFTDHGFVRLRVSSRTGASGENLLRFEVADTGCGLPPNSALSLFEPFSRAEGVSHKPGAGLGLAIVKELVTLLGGHIEAENNPGQGAKFTLEIPAIEDYGQAAATAAQDPPVPKLNVLVADDTRSSLLLIRMLLERRGHRVVTVSDGQAAVEASASDAFDLVLLDIQMPLLNGFEAAAIIRRQFAFSPGKRPLVSALTAQVLPEDQTRARAAGMDHLLRKPFEAHELDALLRAAAANAAEPENTSAERLSA